MLFRKTCLVVGLFLVSLWCSMAAAEGVSLNGAMVERFLRDFPGYVAQLQRFENASGTEASDYLSYHATAKEVIRYLEDRNWTPEGFAGTSAAVLQAYSAIKVQQAADASADSMAAGRRRMEEALRDPSLTPEMRAAMQQSMQAMASAQQSQASMGAQVPPEHLALVAPYVGQIEQMLDALSEGR